MDSKRKITLRAGFTIGFCKPASAVSFSLGMLIVCSLQQGTKWDVSVSSFARLRSHTSFFAAVGRPDNWREAIVMEIYDENWRSAGLWVRTRCRVLVCSA